MASNFSAKEKAAIEVEIQAAIDSLGTPVEDELREVLAMELWEKVEDSTQPEEVVIGHIRENYEITRDFKFPEGSLEDEAMYLLHFQTIAAIDYLKFVVEQGSTIPCEHFPRDGSYTLKEMAGHALETVKEQLIEHAEPAETNGHIEAAIARSMERFEGMEEDLLKVLEVALRKTYLDSSDPAMVLRRRLSRYELSDQTVAIPEDERLDRAIHLLMVRQRLAVTAVGMIASSELSCGDHHVIYAGGVESPGNRIFTAEQVAQSALDEIEGHTLERIHIEPVSK